ncbi:MAG: membrane protein insertase YidC [Pseudomonadota bacterium]|jgi:YidC/Oxa1 family membrane protein insertase
MDSQRLILVLIFSFSLVMLWEGWQKQNQPKAPAAKEQTAAQQGAAPTPQTQLSAGPAAVPAPAGAAKAVVKTDLLIAEISSAGGNLTRLELTRHKADFDKSHNFVLLDAGGKHRYAAQSGLIGDNLPTHKTEFTLTPGTYELAAGSDVLTVRLQAPETDGIKVAKIYTFRRGSYVIEVAYEITNGRQTVLAPHAYFQLVRSGQPPEGNGPGMMGVQTFTGPAVYTEEGKFQKLSFEDIAKDKAKFVHKAKDGWIAMVQHYFVSAVLPPPNLEREYFARKLGDDLYAAGVIVPAPAVAPGQTVQVASSLYAGPQEQDKLAKIAPGLELVVDYGWLTVIAAPLFWVLELLYKLVGNWGWAIILLTVLIKLIFFPLSAASYRSMAKMRLVTPKLMKIKEQYGNDRVRMNQEMMELYKKEKINPLGGCLPILVQIPVFIALYWVLLGSVEMRHAPWLGWIQDLSAKDPYFILPVIMGVTMFVQTKLNPTPPDPIQAKVMLAMPIVFTFMFLWFPAGLVLYWTVNNILSIAQQWQITRMIEGGKPKTA